MVKEKRLDYELMRLAAIFLVVFNHTEIRGFELFMLPECSAVNYIASLVLGVICEAAVPLFLLVSGGLLLNREESFRELLQKRVLRIVLALVVFSFVLYLFHVAWGYVPHPGVKDFFHGLWKGNLCAPYWYLYTYLGLLLMLPFLRPMVRNLPDQAFVYLAALQLVIGGLLGTFGVLTGWGSFTADLLIPMILPGLFYFLMGEYFANRFRWDRFTGRWLALSWVVSLCMVIVMAFLGHVRFRRGEGMINYQSTLLLPLVFSIYASVRRFCETVTFGHRSRRVLETLGSCVFGCYLMEGIMRHFTNPIYEVLEPRIHVLPACMVWVLAVVISGLAAAWVLKKLPLLRDIL